MHSPYTLNYLLLQCTTNSTSNSNGAQCLLNSGFCLCFFSRCCFSFIVGRHTRGWIGNIDILFMEMCRKRKDILHSIVFRRRRASTMVMNGVCNVFFLLKLSLEIERERIALTLTIHCTRHFLKYNVKVV